MSYGSPTVLLYIFLVLTHLMAGVYFASGIELPPLFELLYTVSFFWIIGWWLWSDLKKRNIPWVYDTGFFLYLAWPFIMPYFLFKSRGLRALLTIAAFVVVYAGTFVTGIVLYLLLAPPDWPSILDNSQ